MPRGTDTTDTAQNAISAPHCVIVAGPNGAGKTTSSNALVTERHHIQRIVNPDAVAVGLAGVAQLGALTGGKLALEAQQRYIAERVDFALETTLSGRRWPLLLDALEAQQYRVSLYYLWLPDPDLCVARVQGRVMLGGHGIPEADIRRRYVSGLRNLRDVFVPRVEAWHVYDATAAAGVGQIAHGGRAAETIVYDLELWQRVQRLFESIPPNSLPSTSPRRGSP